MTRKYFAFCAKSYRGLFGILMALTIWAGMIALFFYIAYRVIRTAVKHGIMDAYDEIHK